MSHMPVLRWILVLLLVAAGVFLGFAAALVFLGAARHFCPPEWMISGMCNAPWFPAAQRVALCSGAALGAFACVVLPSCVAPARRRRVAVGAFTAGSSYALWFAVTAGAAALLPLASALAAGMVGVGLVFSRSKVQPGPSVQQAPGGGA
jgi:hypothetical protein